MHAVYKTNATWTGANVIADLVKLITGETTIANLSASCDQATTSIVSNTVPADWTVHDAAGGANSLQILKHLPATGAVDKYIGLSFNNGIVGGTYAAWNNVAHTGTDAATIGAIAGNTLTSAITIYLWVTGRYVVLFTFNNASWSEPILFGEIDRAHAASISDFWAEGNAKSVSFVMKCSYGAQTPVGAMPRIKNHNAAGEVSPVTPIGPLWWSVPQNSSAYSGSITYMPRNIDDSAGIMLWPFHIGYGSVSVYSYIGKVVGLFTGPTGTNMGLASLDEFSHGGKTYQVVRPGGAGYLLLFVPKE
jgi:hypothetical protein